MLVVEIKLWPFGNKGNEVVLEKLHIINDGSGTFSLGNYKIKLFDSKTNEVAEEVELKGFQRNQNSLSLLSKALKLLNYE